MGLDLIGWGLIAVVVEKLIMVGPSGALIKDIARYVVFGSVVGERIVVGQIVIRNWGKGWGFWS